MDTFNTFDDPRCPQCNVPLIRAGAICVGCDEGRHYSSPDRTSPVMRFEQVSGAFDGLTLDAYDIDELEDGLEERTIARQFV